VCTNLIDDPSLAKSLVRNAQAFLAERYDMKANMQKTLSRSWRRINEPPLALRMGCPRVNEHYPDIFSCF